MPDPVDIVFRSRGLDKVLKDYERLEAANKGANGSVLVKFASRGAQGAGGANAKGAGGLSAGAQMRTAAQAQIYAARVQTAQTRQQTQATLAQIKIQKAQYQLSKLQSPRTPPSFDKRLNTFIRSTRFGGGGAMPLVGRAADLLGPEAAEAATGPVGIAIAAVSLIAVAAYKGAEAIEQMSEQAAMASRVFQGLRFSTGGTVGETARLATLGSAAGIGAEGIAGLSNTLQERISSDPFARSVGGKLGVFNLDRRFGNTDEGANLLRVISALRAEDAQSRLRDTRILGLDAASPLFNLSKRQFGLTEQDANVKSQVFNPRFAEQSADFMASLGRVSDSFENLMAALSPAFLPVLTQFFNDLASDINIIVEYVTTHQAMIMKVSDWLLAVYDLYTDNWQGAADHIKNITSGKDDRLARSLDANTDAVNTNTGALGVGQPGSYGVMTRQGALGDGMGGEALRRGLDAQGFQLGSFG